MQLRVIRIYTWWIDLYHFPNLVPIMHLNHEISGMGRANMHKTSTVDEYKNDPDFILTKTC